MTVSPSRVRRLSAFALSKGILSTEIKPDEVTDQEFQDHCSAVSEMVHSFFFKAVRIGLIKREKH